MRSGEGCWKHAEFIVGRNNVREQLKRVKPKPGWGGQPWFYLRLVAYSFLGLSEGA
jgi:hypothetical protein